MHLRNLNGKQLKPRRSTIYIHDACINKMEILTINRTDYMKWGKIDACVCECDAAC